MSNTAAIVSLANTLITLLIESKKAVGPALAKIAQAQAEGRDVTDADVAEASASEDAARKRVEDALK